MNKQQNQTRQTKAWEHITLGQVYRACLIVVAAIAICAAAFGLGMLSAYIAHIVVQEYEAGRGVALGVLVGLIAGGRIRDSVWMRYAKQSRILSIRGRAYKIEEVESDGTGSGNVP